MSMLKRVVLATVLLGALAGSFFVVHFYRIFFAPNTAFDTPTQEVLIPSENTKVAAYDTITQYVDHVDLFKQAAIKKGYAPIPGRFVFDNGMSNNEMINRLRIDNCPVKITFNNQKTLMHLAGYMATKIEADSTSIVQAFLDTDFLNENGFTATNSFAICLPNTYEFFWNTSAEQFRDRMLLEYNRFWTDKREAARKKIN